LDHEICNKPIGHSGSTSLSVVVDSSSKTHYKIYAANIGDTKAVVSSPDGKIHDLSYDHNARDEGEKQRLINSGFRVFNHRVDGMLAVTRAFGDRSFNKKKQVLSTPFVSTIEIEKGKNQLLLLATDGFWDVFDNKQVSEAVSISTSFDPQVVSDNLLKEAMKKGSTDNIAIVVVRLS